MLIMKVHDNKKDRVEREPETSMNIKDAPELNFSEIVADPRAKVQVVFPSLCSS